MAAAINEAQYTIQLPQYSKEGSTVATKRASYTDPHQIATRFLAVFEAALSSGDVNAVTNLLLEDAWWRDHLALSWDFHTLRALPAITRFLTPSLAQAGFKNLKVQKDGKYAPHRETPIEGLEWIEFMFDFDTAVGSGKGMLRLVSLPNGSWKAHMVYTSLLELEGFAEIKGETRPHGGNNSLKGGAIEGNWLDRRERQKEFLDAEPTVLVIGAGQGGLNMGARLQALGLSCLLIDKNERVGDNWRHRYRTLVTHDPVQYTHLAFMKFPENWPLFTPKDKLGDWFEIYATAMELNIWLKTTIGSAVFNEDTRDWTVTLTRGDGSTRVVKPQHVVFSTGHAGEPKIPSFPGQSTFKGKVYHGSQHQDASALGEDLAGKKVVVVGTGNSGHDISQNYYENGASVTMLQRAGTYVISASKGLFMLHEGVYDEHGPPTEDADVAGQSLPIQVQFALNIALTKKIAEVEKENLEGLKKIGFKVDFGSDGSGIYRKYITRGGGYYIDVGASQLLIDGKIKLEQSPDGIKGFTEKTLVLADGRELEADIVILATGFDNMKTTLRKVLGDTIADKANDVWDLDEEGEVNAMWRPSGHPKLWFFGGSLALARVYSKIVALQIKASVEKLPGAQV